MLLVCNDASDGYAIRPSVARHAGMMVRPLLCHSFFRCCCHPTQHTGVILFWRRWRRRRRPPGVKFFPDLRPDCIETLVLARAAIVHRGDICCVFLILGSAATCGVCTAILPPVAGDAAAVAAGVARMLSSSSSAAICIVHALSDFRVPPRCSPQERQPASFEFFLHICPNCIQTLLVLV